MIDIKKMYELEKELKNNFFYQSIDSNEIKYLMKARKLPLEDIKNIIIISNKSWMFLNENLLIEEICQKYHCSESLLNKRIEEVNKIMKYEKHLLNELLKKQKTMIKRMNKI